MANHLQMALVESILSLLPAFAGKRQHSSLINFSILLAMSAPAMREYHEGQRNRSVGLGGLVRQLFGISIYFRRGARHEDARTTTAGEVESRRGMGGLDT